MVEARDIMPDEAIKKSDKAKSSLADYKARLDKVVKDANADGVVTPEEKTKIERISKSVKSARP